MRKFERSPAWTITNLNDHWWWAWVVRTASAVASLFYNSALALNSSVCSNISSDCMHETSYYCEERRQKVEVSLRSHITIMITSFIMIKVVAPQSFPYCSQTVLQLPFSNDQWSSFKRVIVRPEVELVPLREGFWVWMFCSEVDCSSNFLLHISHLVHCMHMNPSSFFLLQWSFF